MPRTGEEEALLFLPAEGIGCEPQTRSPGLRISLLPAPSRPLGQWSLAGFVPVHSCGAAPVFHRLPLDPGQWVASVPFLHCLRSVSHGGQN
jgi:hypothetical protein